MRVQGADIMVFPEYGITSTQVLASRQTVVEWAQDITAMDACATATGPAGHVRSKR